MTRRTRATTVVMAAALGMVGLEAVRCSPAAAEDFRVENSVFVDNEREPRVESTTIFSSGLVYDYLKTPAEVTVFDRNQSRFVLLDIARRVKTEVALDKVTTLGEHLRAWAVRQNDPLLTFLANPRFDEQFRSETGKLVMTSPLITYDLSTKAADSPAVSTQYREFCDWYCQLNTLLNPGSRPPFARLLVNEALDKRQRFPQEVKLSVQLGMGFSAKRMTIRSEHRLMGPLGESDRDRVVQTTQYLTIFSPVSFSDYQKK